MLDLQEIRSRKLALKAGIEKDRSAKWLLRLWSRCIKTRDLYRCVCCGSTQAIQAHHIVRKVLYPWGAFDTGNGVSLCHECHRRVHATFNRRPNMSLPLGAEQGDDQDEWAFLFGLLRDDAVSRGLDEDEFYHLGDDMLTFFMRCQGFNELHEKVMSGGMSRLRFAHEVWRAMPEAWYRNLVAEVIRLNL